jgi:periplasmic divalent cation tolerance protein
MVEPLVVLCTCPDPATARRLAHGLVEDGHAACVNIVPGLHSIYRWQGAVEESAEVLLLAKTERAQYPALEAALRAAHPYELPAVVAVPIVAGSEPYLAWLHASLD